MRRGRGNWGVHRAALSDSFLKRLPQCLLLLIPSWKQCFTISPCLHNHRPDRGTQTRVSPASGKALGNYLLWWRSCSYGHHLNSHWEASLWTENRSEEAGLERLLRNPSPRQVEAVLMPAILETAPSCFPHCKWRGSAPQRQAWLFFFFFLGPLHFSNGSCTLKAPQDESGNYVQCMGGGAARERWEGRGGHMVSI